MDLNDTPEQAEFRARARAWLAEHRHEAPPRHGSHEDTTYIDSRRAWQRRLAEAGLAGVAWPSEFGGQGLDYSYALMMAEELGKRLKKAGYFVKAVHRDIPR